jgi:hypothetical protein
MWESRLSGSVRARSTTGARKIASGPAEVSWLLEGNLAMFASQEGTEGFGRPS